MQSDSFHIEQISTGCLALFTYYVESNKEAVVIDPLREIDSYIELAKSRGATIKYVLETHFHADFVSGHQELAKKTGATIVYGPTAKAGFPIHEAKDNEEIPLGNIKLKVIHTPGHTMESSCYLLLTPKGEPHCLFTGDTLFLGEVGRPDLAVKGNELTEKDLAGFLYDSLRNKIMTLPDELLVYPGHGAGSSCGKSIKDGKCCTIGKQKETNYALQSMTRDEFITILTANIPMPPKYFFHDVGLNKNGCDDLEKIVNNNFKSLSLEEFKKAVSDGYLIIDGRDTDTAKKGYIPGSVCITLATSFAGNCGTVVNPTSKIVLVTPVGKEKEAVVRLARVGMENILGYLEGGIDAWTAAGGTLEESKQISAEEFAKLVGSGIHILDVRNRAEWEEGVIDGAQLIAMPELETRIAEVPKDKPVYVHCRSGVRSFFSSTLLRKYGVNAIDILGGINALIAAGVNRKVPTF